MAAYCVQLGRGDVEWFTSMRESWEFMMHRWPANRILDLGSFSTSQNFYSPLMWSFMFEQRQLHYTFVIETDYPLLTVLHLLSKLYND